MEYYRYIYNVFKDCFSIPLTLQLTEQRTETHGSGIVLARYVHPQSFIPQHSTLLIHNTESLLYHPCEHFVRPSTSIVDGSLRQSKTSWLVYIP